VRDFYLLRFARIAPLLFVVLGPFARTVLAQGRWRSPRIGVPLGTLGRRSYEVYVTHGGAGFLRAHESPAAAAIQQGTRRPRLSPRIKGGRDVPGSEPPARAAAVHPADSREGASSLNCRALILHAPWRARNDPKRRER
jgi:hypothetical protein